MAQPTVGDKAGIEKDASQHATRDEERLEGVGANVADEGHVLAIGH